MKQKIHAFLYRTIAIGAIILTGLIICAMLAGPLMLGWNYSFGLLFNPISYMGALKFIIIIVLSSALIGALAKRGT